MVAPQPKHIMSKPQIVAPAGDKFLTTKQAAEKLGVTLRTVQNWFNSGRVQGCTTMGGHRRIRQSEVDRLLASMANEADIDTGSTLERRLEQAEGHLFDMSLGDDGQAWSEAARYLRRYRPDLADKLESAASAKATVSADRTAD